MNKAEQSVIKQSGQEEFCAVKQKLTFKDIYSSETIKQMQEVDIEIINRSCPAEIVLNDKDKDR